MKEQGCILWQGPQTGDGYGAIKGEGIHRTVWKRHFGPLGKYWVLHMCDNPLCINPEHLWLGTAKENSDDRDRKNRHIAGRAKLTEEQVIAVMARLLVGETQVSVAQAFGISQASVWAIWAGRSYASLFLSVEENTP